MIFSFSPYWINAMKMLDVQKDHMNFFWEVFSKYHESHRAYHCASHLRDCLTEFDRIKILSYRPEILCLSIFGHDVIYDPFSNSNESDSAKYFGGTLSVLGLIDGDVDLIKRLIEVTDHKTPQKNIEEQFICDIDLSIFGKSKETYLKYSKNIRLEYSWVPEEVYRRERKNVLNYFLSRDRIYYTDFFRERYEERARENLANEIKTLEIFL